MTSKPQEVRFAPSAHPALTDLNSRLRDLAGDAAYKAGLDYLRKGAVKAGTVAGTTAFASVSGSTDYRVSISLAPGTKVSCTCPVQRRTKFCKHVVARSQALDQRPGDFSISDA